MNRDDRLDGVRTDMQGTASPSWAALTEVNHGAGDDPAMYLLHTAPVGAVEDCNDTSVGVVQEVRVDQDHVTVYPPHLGLYVGLDSADLTAREAEALADLLTRGAHQLDAIAARQKTGDTE